MENPTAPGLVIEESARRLGALAWVESELHRVLGGWVVGISEPGLKLVVAELSEHHAWRAGQLVDRIPRVRHQPPSTWTVPSEGGAATIRVLEEAAEPLPARWIAYVRCVLPQLVEAYDTLRADCSPVSDAPALRTIGILRRDLVEDLAAETARVFGVFRSEDETEAVGVLTGRLDAVRISSGALSPR